MAVRYVALIDRAAPDARPNRSIIALLVPSIALDLELYDTETGLRLYRNGRGHPRHRCCPTGLGAHRKGREP